MSVFSVAFVSYLRVFVRRTWELCLYLSNPMVLLPFVLELIIMDNFPRYALSLFQWIYSALALCLGNFFLYYNFKHELFQCFVFLFQGLQEYEYYSFLPSFHLHYFLSDLFLLLFLCQFQSLLVVFLSLMPLLKFSFETIFPCNLFLIFQIILSSPFCSCSSSTKFSFLSVFLVHF